MSGEGRFYESEFPEVDDVVVVQVKRIVAMGAYVSLLEYDGREGMMLLSELSKRRIRSVAKLLKVGRTEICMVMRADLDKGYVDLSKRRVDPEDSKLKQEQFARAKAVHGVIAHVAQLHEVECDELSKKISWPLNIKYQDAHEAFKKHINEEIDMWKEIDFSEPGVDLTDKMDAIKADIEISLRRRLITQALRIRAKIDVSCSLFEGIDAIKESLLKGFEASSEECEVKIQLIAHPMFMLTCTCRDKPLAFSTLEKAMDLIKEAIVSKGGEFGIKAKPELVGDQEEEADESDSDSGSGGDDDEDVEGMGGLDEKELEALKKKTGDIASDDE